MFDIPQFEIGAVTVALTGAAIGWSLRPLFLRYRRAFVVAAAALVTVGAAAYELFDEAPAPAVAPAAVQTLPPRVADVARTAAPAPVATVQESGFWADYLEQAGNDAFAERDYQTAIRYWRDAEKLSPLRGAYIAQAIARAEAEDTLR
jgi:hypothetical protein